MSRQKSGSSSNSQNETIDREQLRRQEALQYHSREPAGKSEVVPTKPCLTARDLSKAYSPGVAWPCLEIHEHPEDVFEYTNKGNLVGVISNGTAVLGLGNIGPAASKPVMEGKGVLFKRFADIDVFDLEVDSTSVDEFVNTVKALEPTFGGINLEDLKAPECFEIEKALREQMNIPVFHDDQHGTAIITAAAFQNAVELAGKKIDQVKIVFSGAGAAAMACSKLLFSLGVPKENLTLCDSKGPIYLGRTDGMNPYKEEFAIKTDARDLASALDGADAFLGCSVKGVLKKEMVAKMAKNPIIFAMANPDPEILPEEVAEVRSDAIMATGRSDYPNQVNNVLGFPFIFRGALDVRATCINEEMKLAAAKALAELAREDVPEDVKIAYGNKNFQFGTEYLIPKPFDKRVLTRVAPAVAKAAIDSGVAKKPIQDLNQYALNLERRLGQSASFMRDVRSKLPKDSRPNIVFTDGDHPKVLEAISMLHDEAVVNPVILGDKEKITQTIKQLGRQSLLEEIEIIEPRQHEKFNAMTEQYYESRKRRGLTLSYARESMERTSYFGAMMVKQGMADGMITGIDVSYAKAFKPISRVLDNVVDQRASGVVILTFKHKVVYLADCTLQIDPSADDLADIAKSTADLYKMLMNKTPRIAFLSYSNFGSGKGDSVRKVRKATQITRVRYPDLIVDGEMQADVAVSDELLQGQFNFAEIDSSADVLVFPDLNSSNIAYKLLTQLGDATAIGPILCPIQYPINILQRTATVPEIVSMTHVTSIISQASRKTYCNLI